MTNSEQFNLYTREEQLVRIVFSLIKTSKAQNWIENLIKVTSQSNPANTSLKAIAEKLLGNSPQELLSVPTTPTKQQKILILSAMSQGLRLDKEIQKIEDSIRRANKRDLFDVRKITAVRPQDIRRKIAEERPQIIHFCGHGLEVGSLLLEDDEGNNKPVAPQGLAKLFEHHSEYVNCVVLNACHSVKTADAISKHINYVIGMNQEIGDRAAIIFAEGFYDGLGYENLDHQDVFQRAFDEGLIAIALEDFSQESIPVLKKKLRVF